MSRQYNFNGSPNFLVNTPLFGNFNGSTLASLFNTSLQLNKSGSTEQPYPQTTLTYTGLEGSDWLTNLRANAVLGGGLSISSTVTDFSALSKQRKNLNFWNFTQNPNESNTQVVKNDLDDTVLLNKDALEKETDITGGTPKLPDTSKFDLGWAKGLDVYNKAVANLPGKLGVLAQAIGGAADGIKNGVESLMNARALWKLGGKHEGVGDATAGGIGGILGAAGDLATAFLPEKSEYSGDKGELSKSLDQAYDSIADAAMTMGPWGCVCAGTKVITNEGLFINIEDLKKEDGIIGWGDKQVRKEDIYALKDPGEKECVEIELQSGTILRCSVDHPILYAPSGRADRITINGKRIRVKLWQFIPAELLKIGDNVGIANEIDIWGTEEMFDPYLVGMLIGDGTYGHDHTVRLFSGETETWNYIESNNLGKRTNFNDSTYSKEFREYHIFNGTKYLRDLGIFGQTKLNKRLPINIHKYTKETICKLLAGLIDTDGTVYISSDNKDSKIIFYLSNIELIKEVRNQLLKLGIHTSILKTKESKSVIRDRIVKSKAGFKLVIRDKLSLINFYKNIHLNISYKLEALNKIYISCLEGAKKDNRYLSGAKADKVVKITAIGILTIYNLLADFDHTYLANGIITHNTLVGGIMKGGAALGKGLNAAGLGTDGMCVCAGTKVYTANGEIVNIEDLLKELGIIGWRESTKEIVQLTIHNLITPTEKECLEIELKSGHILRCSIDHPILSDISPKAKSEYINGKQIAIRQWSFRRADELEVGNFVGLANNIDYWGTKEMPLAYLVGMLIGDGTYGKGNSCRIISADKETWDYLEDNNLGVINHCDDSRPDKYLKEIRTYRIIDGMDLMRELGIVYQTGKNKTLPKNLGRYTKESICALLSGLFDTDGSISINEEKGSYSITLYLSNLNLLKEVKDLLHKLGIFSVINTRKAAKYELGGRIINSKESYRLLICDITSIRTFYKAIKLNIKYKLDNLTRIYKYLENKQPLEHNDLSGAKLSKIVRIASIGKLIVYNLLANNDHTYLANGIITHNTNADAILGSSFLNLTPVGLINSAGAQKTDSFTKDEEALADIGGSYTGFNNRADDAAHKAGKKYGLFSKNAYNRANLSINKAASMQLTVQGIAKDTRNKRILASTMSSINLRRRQMSGARFANNIRAGKLGMVLDIAERLRNKPIPTEIFIATCETPQFKEGGVIKSTYINIATIPTEIFIAQEGGILNSDNLEDLEAIMNYVYDRFPILKTLPKVSLQLDSDFNPGLGNIEYMTKEHDTLSYYNDYLKKDKGNSAIVYNDNVSYEDIALDYVSHGLREYSPEWNNLLKLLTELPEWKSRITDQLFGMWLNSKDIPSGEAFRLLPKELRDQLIKEFDLLLINEENYNSVVDGLIRAILVKDSHRKQSQYESADAYKELTKNPHWESMYNLIFNNAEKFLYGGAVNVIPEGALHARLHHMEDAQGLTKKGIPVVTDDGDLQAEIERGEIIFRISVTKKLEELMKEYNDTKKDDSAIEAGKLIVDEILNNTLDNTKILI